MMLICAGRNQMNEILYGSGQGTRSFYLNEKSERVWIDMPSTEWQKYHFNPRYPNKNETNQKSPKGNNL